MSRDDGRIYQETVDWLLSSSDPAVRLGALKELGGLSKEEPEVQSALHEAMQTGPIPKILAKQKTGGFWDKEEDFYGHKYNGTVWNIILLANLGADASDV